MKGPLRDGRDTISGEVQRLESLRTARMKDPVANGVNAVSSQGEVFEPLSRVEQVIRQLFDEIVIKVQLPEVLQLLLGVQWVLTELIVLKWIDLLDK